MFFFTSLKEWFDKWFDKWCRCMEDGQTRSFRSIFQSFFDTTGDSMLYMTSSLKREVLGPNHSPNSERNQCPLSNLDEDYEH